MRKAFFTLIILLASTLIYAQKFSMGGFTYNVVSEQDQTVEITLSPNASQFSGEVTIPTSVNRNSVNYKIIGIGYAAFWYCENITKINIPNTIEYIGDKAFNGCNKLKDIVIPTSVRMIGDMAFGGCSELSSITLGDSLESIGDNAFNCCDKLLSITIPNSVKSIGKEAFYGCLTLKTFLIGNGLTEIEEGTFWKCEGLKVVRIGSSVKEIREAAFSTCLALSEVTSLNPTPPHCTAAKSFPTTISNTKLRVPKGYKENYKDAIVWKDFGSIVEVVPKKKEVADSVKNTQQTSNADTIKASREVKDSRITKADTKDNSAGIHVVVNGESLERIARKYNLSLTELRSLNPSVKGDKIQIGQKLVVKKNNSHTNKTEAVTSTKTTTNDANPEVKVQNESKPEAKPEAKTQKESKPEETNTITGNDSIHIVAKGESLELIANKYSTTVSTLRKINPGIKGDVIQIGQELFLKQNPNTEKTQSEEIDYSTAKSHIVVKGDSLELIARKYSTTIAELRKLNPKIQGDKIKIGETLKIR